MLVDLFDKLINRCIQLAERREKARKHLFDDFISPIYQEFEAIHNEYIQSFRRYRELIKSSKTPLRKNSPILDLVREDLLFTSGQRAKVIELLRFSNEPAVGQFISAIHSYLINTDAKISESLDQGFEHHLIIPHQVWRQSLLGELELIFDGQWQPLWDRDGVDYENADEWVGKALDDLSTELKLRPNDRNRIEKIKKHLAVNTLDELVDDMQGAYGLVTHEFAKLKTELTRL